MQSETPQLSQFTSSLVLPHIDWIYSLFFPGILDFLAELLNTKPGMCASIYC